MSSATACLRAVLHLGTRTVLSLAMLWLTVMPVAAAPPPASREVPLPDGRHYRQGAGKPGAGFDLRDLPHTPAGVASFWTTVRDMGGPAVLGYPISQAFVGRDGCVYQLLQRVVLQACPHAGVRFANTFELLEVAGRDAWLAAFRSVPLPIRNDGARSYQKAVRIRLGWLTDQGIREAYLRPPAGITAPWSVTQAINLYGLPMSRPQDWGPFVSQRFQRLALQRWKVPGPAGIRPGDVTPVLGGMLVIESKLVDGDVIRPHRPGESRLRPLPRVATWPPQPPPVRTVPLAYGFQAEMLPDSQYVPAIHWTKAARFGWLKQQVRWNAFEPLPGRYSTEKLQALDRVVNQVWVSGLNLMLSIVAAPDFYAASPGRPYQVPNHLARFLRMLATRYRGKVRAYETWNEPNLMGEGAVSRVWPEGPREFVALQRAAYRAVKAADPAALVVFPALAPTGIGEREGADRSYAMDDRVFLEQVYRVNGGEIRRYFDVMGVHSYGYNNPPGDWLDVKTVPSTGFKGHPSFYFRRFTQLRQVMLRYGDDKPMWMTEMGWTSCRRPAVGHEFCLDNSEAQRARYLVDALRMLDTQYPYVHAVFIWNLNFRSLVPEEDQKWGYGLRNPDGTPTPAYLALRDLRRRATSLAAAPAGR